MGQTLSEPIKDKHTTSGKDDRMYYGASSMQGWRISKDEIWPIGLLLATPLTWDLHKAMEDAHTTLLDVLDNTEGGSIDVPEDTESSAPKKKFSFFAVYDGHGGALVAEYSGKFLHKNIIQNGAFEDGNFKDAIKNGFLKTDEELKRDPVYNAKPAGCTAVTALITDDWKVFCGNAGDSRAVLSRQGKAHPLSYDHKPLNPDEASRIRAAGGFVEFGRVNGNLALSRAIGDFEYKQNSQLSPERQIVTADPEIREDLLSPGEDEFIIIACDGIWDCMTNQRAVDFVRERIAEGDSLELVAENIMEYCCAEDLDIQSVGADNMTVVIIALLDGRTVEEWTATIKERWSFRSATATEDEPSEYGAPPKNETTKVSGEGGGGGRGGGLVVGNVEDDDETEDEEPGGAGIKSPGLSAVNGFGRKAANREPIFRH
ncbi:Protein phosphatase 2C 2 [Phlyctochytrium planicorne]|nr:Protein phosphatase 2C 2 [Phlyctochytrium planicorne]